MKILIESIPHSSQRYDTPGDWWESSDGTWHIRVSELLNWREEILLAVHELVEMALCAHGGISWREVDEFDFDWVPPTRGIAEPGDDPAAPYFLQHRIASKIERTLAKHLRVDWAAYEAHLIELTQAIPPE